MHPESDVRNGRRSRRVGRWTATVLAVGLVVLGGLEGAYRMALKDLPALPGRVEPPREEALEYEWKKLGGTGEIRVQPLYPWRFYRIVDLGRLPAGLKAAHWIAYFFVLNLEAEGKVRRSTELRRGLRERALVIWLTRNWSAEEIVGWSYRSFAQPVVEPRK
jgi:hypothetical protein